MDQARPSDPLNRNQIISNSYNPPKTSMSVLPKMDVATEATRPQKHTPEKTLGETINAMAYNDYGDPSVIKPTTINLPQSGKDQVLIQVVATSVNPIDCRLRSGEMKGLLPGGFPRVPGYDVAGFVADCPGGGRFAKNDPVMAFLDQTTGGACADYAVCGVDAVAKMPHGMPFEEAAAIPLAGTTALQSLRDHGGIQMSDRVLINGGSGGVGMFAIQIAASYGCHVDAVASGSNESFCRSLGVNDFFDYEKTEFASLDRKWNLIFDVAGKSSYLDARKVLADGGRYVSTEPSLKGIAVTVLTWPLAKSGKVMLAKPKREDLETLLRLYRQGDLKVVIDKRFEMSQLADAHRRVESGVDHGKVIVRQ